MSPNLNVQVRKSLFRFHGKGCAKHAAFVQTLPTVRQTCPCSTTTCLYLFAQFPSCGIFTPTRTISSENYELKQQGDGAGETSRTTNYELQGTGWATRAPVTQTLQSVRQTCSYTTTTCFCTLVRFPLSGKLKPTHRQSTYLDNLHGQNVDSY